MHCARDADLSITGPQEQVAKRLRVSKWCLTANVLTSIVNRPPCSSGVVSSSLGNRFLDIVLL